MLVQCPECETTYTIDDAKLGPQETRVRCSRCKHVFAVSQPEESLPPIEDEALDAQNVDTSSAPKSELEEDLDAFFAKFAGKLPKEVRETPDEQENTDFSEDEFESSPPEAALNSEVVPPATAPEKAVLSEEDEILQDLRGAFQPSLLDDEPKTSKKTQKKSRTLLFVLLGLLVLLAAGVALYGKYYIIPDPTAGQNTVQPLPENVEPSSAVEVAQIAIDNVRQYFLPNEKEGQLFVIEGEAVNHFETPRGLIRLKATLFDRNKNEVSSQEFTCGNVLSQYKLQVSTQQEIVEALAAKVGILAHNSNVQSGGSTPFMVVFFKTPETVDEYEVVVTYAQDSE